VDARSDIFSLGMVIYEMLAGRSPFVGATGSDIVASILNEQQPPITEFLPDVPTELEWIVNRALAKDKNDRYQSSGELLGDLKKLRQDLEFEYQKDRPDRTHSHSLPGMMTASMPARSLTVDEPRALSTAASHVPPAASDHRRRIAGLSLLLLVPAIVLIAYLYYVRKAQAVDSIAVLPFTYTNADQKEAPGPEGEWLSDGITESIINSLSHVPNLKVIARGSVFRYKGREVDPQTVGRDLKVRAVVTGRIIQIGDTLSVQTELVDVQNQTQLWGERYKRKVSDVLDLPEDISREISEGLKLELTGDTKKQIVKRYTANPQG